MIHKRKKNKLMTISVLVTLVFSGEGSGTKNLPRKFVWWLKSRNVFRKRNTFLENSEVQIYSTEKKFLERGMIWEGKIFLQEKYSEGIHERGVGERQLCRTISSRNNASIWEILYKGKTLRSKNLDGKLYCTWVQHM